MKSKIAYQVSPASGTTITDDLLNLSPRSYNATLYYDDGSFSARVSGSYRSAFLTRVPGQNNNDVEGKNDTFNVDDLDLLQGQQEPRDHAGGREPHQRGQ